MVYWEISVEQGGRERGAGRRCLWSRKEEPWCSEEIDIPGAGRRWPWSKEDMALEQ